MKKILSLVLAITTILTATAFLPANEVYAEDAKATIRVYNWGEYISNGDDESLDVIAEFEARFSNIKVDYKTYATNEEMYAKIASGSADYDVLIPSDYMISKMISEDMLAPIDFANIPNYSKIDDTFKNLEFDPENKYSIPYTWGTVGIIYNTTKVTDPVDSWDILWNEKYKGQILMFDNPRDAFGISQKKLGYSQNTTDRGELDKVKEDLIAQKSVVQAYVMDDIFPKMTSGEAALAPYYAGDAITMISDNPDLAYAVPNEGTNTFVDSMVIPKTSKNKAAAETFINFMLEDDIAKSNIEYIGYSTPMTNVREQLDEELKNNPISYPDASILAKCDTFINLDDDTNSYMMEAWTDVKSSGENNIGGIILLVVLVLAVVAVLFFMYQKKRKNAPKKRKK